jgi:2-polyprenyl-3-methyl-5-hydroxy-6-metoxy-1,4-benzoquinol methylase
LGAHIRVGGSVTKKMRIHIQEGGEVVQTKRQGPIHAYIRDTGHDRRKRKAKETQGREKRHSLLQCNPFAKQWKHKEPLSKIHLVMHLPI